MPLTASPRAIQRLHNLIWTLIFVGLFMLVVGLATFDESAALGHTLAWSGGVLAAIGTVLIWVRSRIHEQA